MSFTLALALALAYALALASVSSYYHKCFDCVESDKLQGFCVFAPKYRQCKLRFNFEWSPASLWRSILGAKNRRSPNPIRCRWPTFSTASRSALPSQIFWEPPDYPSTSNFLFSNFFSKIFSTFFSNFFLFRRRRRRSKTRFDLLLSDPSLISCFILTNYVVYHFNEILINKKVLEKKLQEKARLAKVNWLSLG